MVVLSVLLVVVFIIIIFYTASYFFVLSMYRKIQPGDKITLVLEKYNFYEIEDIVVKVENDYIYTKNNGVFTFTDYLNNIII